MFMLPLGFRPAVERRFSVPVGVGAVIVDVVIGTDGTVTAQDNWTGPYHLDCISFDPA